MSRAMEHDNANDNLPPQALCRSGCGFYGSQAFDGLCSKCYKDALKRKQNSSPVNVHVSASAYSGGGNPGGLGQGEKDTVTMESVASALAQASLGADRSTPDYGPVSSPSMKVLASSRSLSAMSPTSHSVSTACPTVSVPCSERTTTTTTTATTLDVPTACDGATGSESSSASSVLESPTVEEPDKKLKKNRCHTCKKKIGLTGFMCRCGGLYCSLHRYSDKHECSFDYRELGQEQIRRNNPVIKGDKLQKI